MSRLAPTADHGRLVVRCADQPGIIAAVSRFLFEQGANIVHSDQHTTDPEGGRFFLRVEFDLPRLADRIDHLRRAFDPTADAWGMEARFVAATQLPRIGVLVSREEHCLLELLWQRRAGDLRAEIPVVIGNHPEIGEAAAAWGIPFHCVPLEPATKARAEAEQERLLREAGVDLVVLARYMQIVSPAFVARWQNRAINIHHSFLPAFAGARPFAQAHARGVKLIGATAHYVTADLDAGPIIEQDVRRVDHRDTAADLRRISRQIERAVLARAVAWHVEDRVIVDGNRTIVFA